MISGDGGCARCTFRRAYEDLGVPLMTAVQCTEPPGTDRNQTRQVLLNDGRQFVLTTALGNDSNVSPLPESSSVAAASHSASMRVTAESGSRTAGDAELATSRNDLSLRDETQAAAAFTISADGTVQPCPVCQSYGFATVTELQLHINNMHLDTEDNVG